MEINRRWVTSWILHSLCSGVWSSTPIVNHLRNRKLLQIHCEYNQLCARSVCGKKKNECSTKANRRHTNSNWTGNCKCNFFISNTNQLFLSATDFVYWNTWNFDLAIRNVDAGTYACEKNALIVWPWKLIFKVIFDNTWAASPYEWNLLYFTLTGTS